eukprot:2890965-Rhodomonas_salina.2
MRRPVLTSWIALGDARDVPELHPYPWVGRYGTTLCVWYKISGTKAAYDPMRVTPGIGCPRLTLYVHVTILTSGISLRATQGISGCTDLSCAATRADEDHFKWVEQVRFPYAYGAYGAISLRVWGYDMSGTENV